VAQALTESGVSLHEIRHDAARLNWQEVDNSVVMKSTLPRVDRIAGTDSELSATGQSPVAGKGEGSENSTHARTRLKELEARADAIGQVAPFSAWPRAVLLRLAGAAIVSSHRSRTHLMAANRRDDNIIVVASGTVIASVSSPGGRRVVFKFDDSSYAYGLFSLVDGLAQGHDLVADGQVAVIGIPHASVRSELQRMPSLWETLAVEAIRRARGMNLQMQQFVFDAPVVRAASLLLGMLAKNGNNGERGPVAIKVRLSQERLAELLGTSRQWATTLVRELSAAGLIEWRYGRATVLDVEALRALAVRGIDAMNQRREHLPGH
jgi:CRP/FNR family cyclic AMP-dependent transcriptional regulator